MATSNWSLPLFFTLFILLFAAYHQQKIRQTIIQMHASVDQTVRIFSPKVYELFQALLPGKIRQTSLLLSLRSSFLIILLIALILREIVTNFSLDRQLILTTIEICLCFGSILIIWFGHLFRIMQNKQYNVNIKQINYELNFVGNYHFIGYGFVDDELFVKSSIFLAKITQLNLAKPLVRQRVALNICNLLLFFAKAADYYDHNQNKFIKYDMIFQSEQSELSLNEMIKKVDEMLLSCQFDLVPSSLFQSGSVWRHIKN